MVLRLSDSPRLYALSNPYPVDGRVSWHPADARGWAASNCYLCLEEEAALLIDTGLGMHRDQLLSELEGTLPSELPLSIVTLRQGEFDSIGNLIPICAQRPVRTVLGAYPEGHTWGDIYPDVSLGEASIGAAVSLPPEAWLGLSSSRYIEVVRPALRLLNTYWLFDEETGTAFTSDSFVHVLRESEDGPWLLDESERDCVTESIVEGHLLANRFWWLPRARTDEIRREVADFFAKRDVVTLAPAFGTIIHGRSVVAQHVDLIDRALAGRVSAQAHP